MSAAGPGSGFILFCICPIAQAQDGACHGTQWLSLRTESPIEPPTGTQHSLKRQATMLRDTPVGVQHFLPLWQEASPPDVPRRSGNHPKAVRAMMNFRNGAAHLLSVLCIWRGSYQTLQELHELCFCKLLTIPPKAAPASSLSTWVLRVPLISLVQSRDKDKPKPILIKCSLALMSFSLNKNFFSLFPPFLFLMQGIITINTTNKMDVLRLNFTFSILGWVWIYKWVLFKK